MWERRYPLRTARAGPSQKARQSGRPLKIGTGGPERRKQYDQEPVQEESCAGATRKEGNMKEIVIPESWRETIVKMFAGDQEEPKIEYPLDEEDSQRSLNRLIEAYGSRPGLFVSDVVVWSVNEAYRAGRETAIREYILTVKA